MANDLPTPEELRTQRRKNRLRLMWIALAAVCLVFWSYCLLFDQEGMKKIGEKLSLKDTMVSLLIYALFPVVLLLMFAYSRVPEKKWVKRKSFTKFLVSSGVPGLCILLGNVCEGDVWLFLFFVFYSTSLLMCMLAFEAVEDFGFSDMLVAVALGFLPGPINKYWRLFLVAMLSTVKAFFPWLYTLMYGKKPAKDSILADLETSLRAANWDVESFTKEEAVRRVGNLETYISEVLKKIKEIGTAATKLSQEVAKFKFRM